jgi:UDP-N-acetylmuramoylalanine--D-glutamate ligase
VTLPERALVVGLARSGQAAALALARRGTAVVAVDRNPNVDAGRLVAAGVEVRLGDDEGAPEGDDVDVLIKSPGVPAEAPPVRHARERGVPVWSEVELGWRLLAPRPFVGVTGTKGKTTTTELLGAMFRAAGRPVEVAGNVGRPLTSVEAAKGAWIVCELSSFQLEDVHELSLEVAVLLNLAPDHLDRHGSFEAYRDAKLRIFERAAHRIVPPGFEGTVFSARDPLPAEPLLPGAHNRANAAAATAAARAAGLPDEAIAQALRTFAGISNRLELVADRGGVRWVNDSIATNTFAVLAGTRAFHAPIRLILGGRSKGEDYGAFARELPPNVVALYLVGEAADELATALDAAGRSYELVGTIEAAVAAGAREAQPGDIVLLSPAATSYDQYADFEERGEDFRRLVRGLP